MVSRHRHLSISSVTVPDFPGSFPEVTSYDTRGGLHRIDRLPEGKYVLLESKVPDGYQGADPMLITVDQSGTRYPL